MTCFFIIQGQKQANKFYRKEITLTIGQSLNNRLLIVSYTEQGNTFRIISAREATRKERKDYEEG